MSLFTGPVIRIIKLRKVSYQVFYSQNFVSANRFSFSGIDQWSNTYISSSLIQHKQYLFAQGLQNTNRFRV